ncbi:MAG: transport permease protein [marine bacterium B5-7]|nr:MAG: transport permease protein [marine bacterium B5-7]
MLASLVLHRDLIYQLTRRAIVGRYRGSIAGVAWSLVIPITMLVVYTFVFGFVFKMRFNLDNGGSNLTFAAFLFSGIVVHGFFAECLNRAPGVIANNSQYVKKIVFPLECLVWVAIFTALFQTTISITILSLFLVITRGVLHWTILFAPIVLAPLLILAAGVIWIIGALSVYIRDFAQLMGVLTTLMLFLGPVFYPLHVIPEPIRYVFYLNPISFVIEQMRRVMLDGIAPDWVGLVLYTLVAILIAKAGLRLFNRMRNGFPDVL